MIIYAGGGGGALKGTDNSGDSQSIGVIDASQNTLKTGDDINRELLFYIIKELKILNSYMSLMNDTIVTERDIEKDMVEILR